MLLILNSQTYLCCPEFQTCLHQKENWS